MVHLHVEYELTGLSRSVVQPLALLRHRVENHRDEITDVRPASRPASVSGRVPTGSVSGPGDGILDAGQWLDAREADDWAAWGR
ncbi:hypothetical protein ACH4GE_42665 [Streptomyces tendae]|uniref:hypothetical protein n=1 Tax=Streptomyces tendae TaxID=1932 RepID=UPI0037AC1548